MKKNSKGTNQKFDTLYDRHGVPPDASFIKTGNNVLIMARLSDGQYDELVDVLLRFNKRKNLPQ